MTRSRRTLATCSMLATGALLIALVGTSPAVAKSSHKKDTSRFSTFNASLNRSNAGDLAADLAQPYDGASPTPGRSQAANVAEIIQRVRPDVLLINEFDYDPAALPLFQENYLSVPHNGSSPISYPYRYIAPSNTGVASGFDLDNSGGEVGGPNDALGFGFFEGQFGMAVFSKYPIATSKVRTFRNFLWRDMPGALLPDDAATAAPADWYSTAELAVLPLSSKSHWDLPLRVGRTTVHFLVSHPTPPVFDGAEDRNGRRNHDEIRFWADYVRPGTSRYVYDDTGQRGGLRPGARFVIAGDENSDPLDGDSIPGSTQQLLDNARVNSGHAPISAGAVEASRLQGGANLTHRSDPRFDTADFSDSAPGNLRADYVLPSKALRIRGSGVFWPTTGNPLSRLTGQFDRALLNGFPSSDHRLVWVDVKVSGSGHGHGRHGHRGHDKKG